MKKLVMLFLIGILFFPISKKIPEEAIRLRVLANSNSSYDQEIKRKVKDVLQSDLSKILKDSKNIETSRNLILQNLSFMEEEVSDVLKKENYPLSYSIDYGFHNFPRKEYEGVVYEEGEYESLLVTLGSGLGDNWWCVLFPPFCLVEAEESTEPEYTFFFKEFLDKIFK